MQWFAFGERRTGNTHGGRFGNTKEVGEYALHVQCAWRIVCGDDIIVGSRDLYYPADESAEPSDDFDWDHERTRRDRRIEALFANARSFVGRRVDVGNAGALRIDLGDGYVLEVFPQDSLAGEHWRLFRPYRDEPHVVVTGAGIVDG